VHQTKDRLQAIALLGKTFARSGTLKEVFTPANAARLESAVLRAIERGERKATLFDPTSSAPILWLSARLRVCSADLSRIIWGIALHSPSERLIEELVSA
jgi:hypothetical protein